MNPTSLNTWLSFSADVTSAVEHYETRLRLNECEASSKRRRLLRGLPPITPCITYRAEPADMDWFDRSYIAPNLAYRYGMRLYDPPIGHRREGPMIIGVRLPLWAYPVTVQNWSTFTPIQQVTVGTIVNRYSNHRFMLIPDEGSALNDDYAPGTGLFGYRGVPRALDGTRMFEFDFSIPRDEFGLIHYDVYGNVIPPPAPAVLNAIMPTVLPDSDEDDDQSTVVSQSPLDDASDSKPPAKSSPHDST
jgi:hypothetical protein